MTFTEKIEKALRIGLVKNTFDVYEIHSSEIKETMKLENIDLIIETTKSIVSLINNDNTLLEKEISELIDMVN